MRIVLIGADFEENLGVGMIAAVAQEAGHQVRFMPFNVPSQAEALAERAAAEDPEVIGLSMQFQHRAHEFLSLARAIRERGYRGHITCGGQYPSLAYKEVLEGGFGLSSVVLFDGEETFVDLLGAVEGGGRSDLFAIHGLALLSDDGVAVRTEGRRLTEDLDALPYPIRYRDHTSHFGIPFIPLMGSRGCWGKCSYCSITSFYKDARAHGGGKLLRLRSPEDVAAEMALLWHRAGGPSIFCFHDDNFLLPRPADTLERVRRIRAALDEYGVGEIGIVGKARPDTVTPELAKALAEHGVVRLYVGVENASEAGGAHLRRGTQTAAIGEALRACREAGIFVCYNILLFEPEAELRDIRENLAFIRAHAKHPVNFCRAEPYFGTPLHRELEDQGLDGSFLGWSYRIREDRSELLFRISAAIFRERNFAPDGVANRYMGLGYAANVLRRFHSGQLHSWQGPERDRALDKLYNRASRLTERISLETADFLERAIELVEGADMAAIADPASPKGRAERERIERATAHLGLLIAEADGRWHVELDTIYADMKAFAEEEGGLLRRAFPTEKLLRLARSLTLGASIAAAAMATEGCGMVVDPVPQDSGMVVDPPPPDAGMDAGMVVDPAPDDAGLDADVDAGMDAGMVVDPAPEDGGMAALEAPSGAKKRLDLIDQWRDSSPRRASRSADLPLYAPPELRLRAEPEEDGAFRVSLQDPHGRPLVLGTRWQAEGEVLGDGESVRWWPSDEADQLRVAARSRGGVAVLTLRAKGLPGGTSARG